VLVFWLFLLVLLVLLIERMLLALVRLFGLLSNYHHHSGGCLIQIFFMRLQKMNNLFLSLLFSFAMALVTRPLEGSFVLVLRIDQLLWKQVVFSLFYQPLWRDISYLESTSPWRERLCIFSRVKMVSRRLIEFFVCPQGQVWWLLELHFERILLVQNATYCPFGRGMLFS
jgi:hypothetical protein